MYCVAQTLQTSDWGRKGKATMFQDYLFFGVDSKVFYSYRMLHLSALAEEARKKHGLNLERGLLLSDALLGSLLLSSLLEYEERVNLRIHCGDDFTIGTETTFLGETRGYIECNENSLLVQEIDRAHRPDLNYVVRSIRSQKNKTNLFEGVTSSLTNNIEDALNEHLSSSYQMNTKIRIESWVDKETQTLRAFGIIYQELPEIPENVSDKLATHINSLPTMKELYLENSDPDILAKKAIPDETKAIKSIQPKFVCSCSTAKVEEAVSLFPVKDIEEMIKKSENVEVKCHYCSTNHIVTVSKLDEIYSKILSQNHLN
jgi:molecular chaperone Hsp33